MKRRWPLFAVLVLAIVSPSARAVAQQPKPVDPVGTYSVSTASDTGTPMTGTLVITNGPDGYGGTFSSPGLPAPVVVMSVATNAKQMMATLNNGRGGVALVWVDMLPDGTFKGTWHDLSVGIAATGRKNK